MTELKTLKDIKKEREMIHEQCFECCEDYEPIKQEIIKWIKKLELGKMTLSNGLPETDEKHEKYYLDKSKVKPIIFILKYIFNITKEDLKWDKNKNIRI